MFKNFNKFIILIIFFNGCGPSESRPVLLPPKFNFGDQVFSKNSNKIGIVIDCSQINCNTWEYQIMYNDRKLNYKEEQIILYQHFDWNKEISPLLIPENSQRGIVD